MDDLIAFLRARLDEREAPLREVVRQLDAYAASDGDSGIDGGWDFWGSFGFAADAAFKPREMLADVEAKRQIIDEHAIVHRNIGWLADGDEEYGEIPVCGRCVPKHSHYSRRADVPEWWCRTLRLLALPYADHPDHREEWKP
jgi:hypothetical protein